MRKLLLIIDVQKGFINEQSSWLPANLATYIKKSDYTDVFATKYINYRNTPCYKLLNWKGCMTEEEQAICPELNGLYSRVFEKSTYNSITASLLKTIQDGSYDEIHIVGISTTCCVIATAYDLFDRGFNIKVIPALCSITGNLKGYQEASEFMLRENLPCLEVN